MTGSGAIPYHRSGGAGADAQHSFMHSRVQGCLLSHWNSHTS